MVLKIRGTLVLILAGGFGDKGREDWRSVKILAVDSTRDRDRTGRKASLTRPQMVPEIPAEKADELFF